jgi:hypothetical protein
MTPFDLLFIVSFVGMIIGALRTGYLLARGRIVAARITALRLVGFVALYGSALVLVSLLSAGKVMAVGEPRCFDEWCIAVTGVSRKPSIGNVKANGLFYVVSLRVSSRSRGRRQRENDVYTYLTDGRGRRFEVSPSGQDALERAGLAGSPPTSFVDPGGAFESRLAFDVPDDASDVGFVKTSHGWFPRLLIIGEPGSLLHSPTIVQLSRVLVRSDGPRPRGGCSQGGQPHPRSPCS